MRHSFLYPNEIFSVTDNVATALTEVNKEILGQIDAPMMEKVLVPTTDGKEMTTWVIYPPKFDKTKKYPALLYCQGGPQQAVSQFWSYRWNLMLMASKGYIVIAPNRRGSPDSALSGTPRFQATTPARTCRITSPPSIT